MSRDYSSKLKSITVNEFARMAKAYDADGMYEMVKADYAEIIDEVTREPYSILIDYGCGTGEFLNRISKMNGESKYIGVDITPEILEIAKKKNEGIEFVLGDSEEVSFRDINADVITCIHSFHHYVSPAAFVSNAYESLRPGGRLIIRDNGSKGIFRYLWFNYIWYPYQHIKGIGDVHFYTMKEIKTLCESLGFCSETVEIRNKSKLHCVFRKPD